MYQSTYTSKLFCYFFNFKLNFIYLNCDIYGDFVLRYFEFKAQSFLIIILIKEKF